MAIRQVFFLPREMRISDREFVEREKRLAFKSRLAISLGYCSVPMKKKKKTSYSVKKETGFQVLTVTPCCSHNYDEHILTYYQKKRLLKYQGGKFSGQCPYSSIG